MPRLPVTVLLTLLEEPSAAVAVGGAPVASAFLPRATHDRPIDLTAKRSDAPRRKLPRLAVRTRRMS